ncbi:hypothetical protein BKA70DRAFT_1290814 [Coprinopsis sp. MPI-PUGE-AT-0042]|nr:hypothetical protein BKA70DRAFT_1290814 [Coprinopsis sp. MPI-PUGE-AT-0042]
MSPHIPADIAFQIIDFGEDDAVTLKSTSLVCKIWQDHSQKRLFRTLELRVFLKGDHTIRRLRGLGLASSMRIKQYVRTLSLSFVGLGNAKDTELEAAWLNTHEQLLVQVLKTLPLNRISSFRLGNIWSILDYVLGEQKLVPRFPSIAGCVEDICASPMLGRLVLSGRVPFPQLLPYFPASVETPSDPTPHRKALIDLETLSVRSTTAMRATNESLLSYLLDLRRSLVNLTSLRELEILGTSNEFLNEPLSKLFKVCSDSLESLEIQSLHQLGLRKAAKLKRLAASRPSGSQFDRLADFMERLMQELTPDQQHGGESCPSNLESVTVELHVYSVKEIDYPKLIEVSLVVCLDASLRISNSPLENEHKEKVELAMGALRERGVLRICW